MKGEFLAFLLRSFTTLSLIFFKNIHKLHLICQDIHIYVFLTFQQMVLCIFYPKT